MAFKRFCCLLTAFLVFAVGNDIQAQTGETCETAIPILAPSITNGSTLGMQDDYNEACPYVNINGKDVVYLFTPEFSGGYHISLCTGLTSFDTKMYIYEDTFPAVGSGITGTTYACSDDACENAPIYPHEWVSEIDSLFMSEGTDYYIVVDGYDGFSSGVFTLSLQPDFTFPNTSDIRIVEGRCYNYTEIPQYNLQPTKFETKVDNHGFEDADSVYVVLDIFRESEVYVSTLFSDTSALIQVPAQSTATVVGQTDWIPSDTGSYIFRYTVNWEGTPDDTISNDTIYNMLTVTESDYRANFLGLAGQSALALPGGGSLTEYGVAFRLYDTVMIEAVAIDLETKIAGIGEVVEASVYRAQPGLDSLDLVSTGIAFDLADTSQMRYSVPFSEKLEPGDYVLTYRGSNALVFSAHIFTDGLSNLVRHPVLTANDWIAPPAPLAFSIGMQASLLEPEPVACDTSLPPQNFAGVLTDSTLVLTWDVVPGSLGCRIRAGTPGSTLPKRFNAFSFEVSSFTFPRAPFPPTTFEFAVKCACEVAPPITTDLSDHILVDFSVLREERLAGGSVEIFPNPVSDGILRFRLTEVEDSARLVRITDMTGRVLKSAVLRQNDFNISVEALPPGLYLVQIDGFPSQRFVVAE